MDVSNEDTSGETTKTPSADRKGQSQRTRATFVCVECKRLKLKCDRNQPCQQCFKRNFPDKCRYSPGASEKQDIHTVCMRLTGVEKFMIASTNGRFQPACPSANQPSSQTSPLVSPNYASQLQHPSLHPHQHHHHAAALNHAPTLGSISKSFQSIIPACLEDLQISRNQMSFPVDDMSDSNNFERDSDLSMDPISQRKPTSKAQLRQMLRGHRAQVDTMIPSVTLYVPDQTPTFESPGPLNSSLQVTPTLLSLLPPPDTCRLLFESAEAALFLRRLPFDPSYGSEQGWKNFQKRALEFITSSDDMRNSVNRGDDIYLSGTSQPFVDESTFDGTKTSRRNERVRLYGSSLTFFATTCAALAIGAIHAPTRRGGSFPPYTAEFLYSLSQQALGVWDTRNSSSSSKRSTIKDDAAHMEYLFACLLGVMYLLQSGTVAAASFDESTEFDEETEDGETYELQIVTDLVGKMIACAHNIQLDKEATWTKRKKKRSSDKDHLRDEWKRMIWWEIVFYDLFLADILGQQPKILLLPQSTNLPFSAVYTKLERDEFEDDPQNQNVPNDLSCDDRAPRTRLEIESAYSSARYRLARVAHAVKSRSSQPDCCCGYTLDQAVALENQVWEWQNTLPSILKVSSGGGMPSLFTGSHQDYAVVQAWAHELAIVSNVLVANLYIPFLCPDGSDMNKPRFKNMPATLACTNAAQAIIHLVYGLQRIPSFYSPASPSSKVMLPTMFDFLPLYKLLFNSVVMCGHATFQGISPSMPHSMGAVADDTSLGLEVLTDFESKSLDFCMRSVFHCDDDNEFQSNVRTLLNARLLQRSSTIQTPSGDPANSYSLSRNGQSVSDTDQTMDYQQLQVSQAVPSPHHVFAFSSPSSTLESDYSGTRSPPSSQNSSRSKSKQQDLIKEKDAIVVRRRDTRMDRRNPIPVSQKATSKLRRAMQSIPLTFPHATNARTLAPIETSDCHGSLQSPTSSQVHSRQVDFGPSQTQLPERLDMPPRKRPVLQDIREHHHPTQSSSFIPQNFNHAQQPPDTDYNQLVSPTTYDQGPATGTAPYGMSETSYMNPISLPEQHVASNANPALSTPYFNSYGNAYAEPPPSSNVVRLHTPGLGNSQPSAMETQPPLVSVPNTPMYEHPLHCPPHSQLPPPHHLQNHHMISNPYMLPDQGQPPVGLYQLWIPPPSQECGDGGATYRR